MRRRRTKLKLVPNRPDPRSHAAVRSFEEMIPGLVAGVALAAVLGYWVRRRRNNSQDVGVLTAEVNSNGHAKVTLEGLDQFS